MQFGVDCSQHQQTWSELVGRVQFSESAGFDGAWVFDHFKPLYGSPNGPCLEAWTLLAALGAVTSTIRLGALVTGVTYRHPSVLTASALTVDHVSNGRLEIGIGAAWFDGSGSGGWASVSRCCWSPSQCWPTSSSAAHRAFGGFRRERKNRQLALKELVRLTDQFLGSRGVGRWSSTQQ
jgi:hypothetical protein